MLAVLPCILLLLGYAEDRGEILAQTAPLIELSPGECVVDSILEQLKADAMALQDPGNPWVSQFFPCVREDYMATDLYEFIRRMPKGAVLHLHLGAMGDYRDLFDRVVHRYGSSCYFNPSTSAFHLFADSIPGDQWRLVSDMLAEAPDSAALRDSLFNLIVLDEDDRYLPDLWEEFGRIAGRVDGLFTTQFVVNEYYSQALSGYGYDDHVQHLELRAHRPSAEIVSYLRSEVIGFTDMELYISLKVIYCDSRTLYPGETVEEFDTRITEGLRAAADLMASQSRTVVGADVFGEEDRGATAHYMAPMMEEARDYCTEEYGFELPYFLHDGESSFPTGVPDSPVSLTGPFPGSVNNNVIDAYLLGAERVGHGIELAKLPELAELYAAERIPLEICPISNQVLGFTPDLRDHPALHLMRSGVLITINPDDPAIFQSGGVSCDWLVVVLAWDLSLADLKQLALNSIEAAAVTEEERIDLMERWQAEWDIFIRRYEAAQ